jgi:hypothetical protein
VTFIRRNGKFVALDAVVDDGGQWREAIQVTPDPEDGDEIESALCGLSLDDPEDSSEEGDDERGSA